MAKTPYCLCLVTVLALVLSIPVLVHSAPPDRTPPMIGTPTIRPSFPTSRDPVTVSVNVTDDGAGVRNVTVVYTNDNWTSVSISVAASYDSTTTTATAQIPAQASGVHVEFYVVADDNQANRAVNDNSGVFFGYDVSAAPSPPPSPPPLSLNPVTWTVSTWIIAAVVLGSLATFVVVLVHHTKSHPPSVPQP